MAGTTNRKLLADYLLKQSTFGKNYVLNPSAFDNTVNITASSVTITRNTSSPLTTISDVQVAYDAANDYAEWAMETLDRSVQGRNCELRADYKLSLGSGATMVASVYQNGNLAASQTLQASSTALPISINVPCGDPSVASTFRVTQTVGAVASTLNIANISYGIATNVGSVAQATVFGTSNQAGAAGGTCRMQQTNTGGLNTWVTVGTGSGCNAWSTTGNVSASGTNDLGVVLNNAPPGDYLIELTGNLFKDTTTAATCSLRFTDGTTTFNAQTVSAAGTNTSSTSPIMRGHITYTTAGSRTITVQAATNGIVQCGAFNDQAGLNLKWTIVRMPATEEQAFRPINKLPTVTRLTSGSGTYTVPADVTYIRVRMAGGGGGGSGSGTSAGSAAGAGGNTTFGSSLLTANGGGAGAFIGATTGGTVTVNSPAVNIASVQGGSGSGADGGGATGSGAGGTNAFGGGSGGASLAVAPTAPVANTGAGGAGGPTSNVGSQVSGGGGSAGGFIDAFIKVPDLLSSYSYSIGAGGTAGGPGGGSLPAPGVAGATGVIEITEYYGANAPILIGSVTSSALGAERLERAYISNAGAGTPAVVRQSGNWIQSVANGGAGVGDVVVTFRTGIFSGPPSCIVQSSQSSGASGFAFNFIASGFGGGTDTTATTYRYVTNSTTSQSPNYVDLICMGPRA